MGRNAVDSRAHFAWITVGVDIIYTFHTRTKKAHIKEVLQTGCSVWIRDILRLVTIAMVEGAWVRVEGLVPAIFLLVHMPRRVAIQCLAVAGLLPKDCRARHLNFDPASPLFARSDAAPRIGRGRAICFRGTLRGQRKRRVALGLRATCVFGFVPAIRVDSARTADLKIGVVALAFTVNARSAPVEVVL
jgi:hypothetical protein